MIHVNQIRVGAVEVEGCIEIDWLTSVQTDDLKSQLGYLLYPPVQEQDVVMFAHGARGHQIDPSWWTH